jgi:CheY-like chemotaxis protein
VTHTDHAILIVDDDDDIRELLAEFLEDEGYRVVTARNGLDALGRLRAGGAPPCLILLDLMMPVMNGFQFLEAFRSDPALALIPVAVVSAHGGLGPSERAAIAAPIYAKPLDLDALLEVVGRLC